MARKQIKKRSFGHTLAGPASTATSTLTPSAAASPARTSPKAAVLDYSKYAYVAKDLKQIALILGVILTLYATIFLTNQSLHLF